MISQRMGRILSAVGAVLLIAGLFMTWYHIDRANGLVENATGFDTFTRLRLAILAGAVVLLLTAIAPQTKGVLIVRTLVGGVLGVLILRRIAFPPDIADPIRSQFGVFVGLVGAVCAVLGGAVDTGREAVARYPDAAFWRPPSAEIGAGADSAPPTPAQHANRAGVQTVDSTAEEL